MSLEGGLKTPVFRRQGVMTLTSRVSPGVGTDFIRYSHTIGLCVMEGRGFMFPVDTLIASDGRMHTVSRAYLPATGQLRVTVYDIDSEFYGAYGGYGEGLGQFRWPTAIASDKEGNVYISDEQTNRINIYSDDGTPAGHWGAGGTEAGELRGPSGIAFDADGDLYVSDHLNNRIQKFTKDGQFIKSFADDGDDANRLSLPWGITVGSDGCVYVADWANHRINKYSEHGVFVRSFGGPGNGDGEFSNPASVAVDSDGYIYVADWGNERVQILDRDGDFVTKLRGAATISKWGQDFLDANYEEAEPRSRSDLEPDISLFGGDPHEESAHIEKLFWGPTSVKLDDAGRVYVTESNRHRIQIYERNS